MAKHNAKNERLKHQYYAYLEEAKRMSPGSVDSVAAAIDQFEASTRSKDFSAFHIEQAKRFKRLLNEARNERTRKPLAKSTIQSRTNAVKAFFIWLAGRPGFRSRISYSDCDYFNLSANDARIASARPEPPVPSLEQIQHVIDSVPSETPLERRDRAIIAFTLLSGARDDAIASLNIGHVDLLQRTVFQDGATVRTKNRKTFKSAFFPVGAEIEAIIGEWINELKTDYLFAETDPLFPATQMSHNVRREFIPAGFLRQHWSTADPIRKIFRRAFTDASLPYFNPHSFRKTLALLGQQMCRTPEEMKAWSQNLGHEDMLTTFTSYGTIPTHRQIEVLKTVGERPSSDLPSETAVEILALLRQKAQEGIS